MQTAAAAAAVRLGPLAALAIVVMLQQAVSRQTVSPSGIVAPPFDIVLGFVLMLLPCAISWHSMPRTHHTAAGVRAE